LRLQEDEVRAGLGRRARVEAVLRAGPADDIDLLGRAAGLADKVNVRERVRIVVRLADVLERSLLAREIVLARPDHLGARSVDARHLRFRRPFAVLNVQAGGELQDDAVRGVSVRRDGAGDHFQRELLPGEDLTLAGNAAPCALQLPSTLKYAEAHAGAGGLGRDEMDRAVDAASDGGAHDEHQRCKTDADYALPAARHARARPECSQCPAACAAHRHLMAVPGAIRR
jgi:hypothetical protein